MHSVTGHWLILLFSFLLGVTSIVSGQTTNSNASVSTVLSTTVYTTTATRASTTISGRATRVSSYLTALNVTSVATSVFTPTPSTSPTPTPITLDTKIDPGFGVLGALLILSGLPLAFWGHKNRWFSSAFVGFYTLALVCFVLILQYGILPATDPPSTTLRGLYVLACAVAGIIGAAITVFFWKATKYFIGAWGGLCVGLFIQCFGNGGLIHPIGYRWIMLIGCAAIGFALATIPKLHWHVLLVSTALFGASVFMLGVDCFSTVGLKEFYLWNIGFASAFPKFTNNGIQYPVTQQMEIELGLMAAVAIMGGAVQLRVLVALQKKLKEMDEEQKKRDAEAEEGASKHIRELEKERAQWERDHPTLPLHQRQPSGYSSEVPLLRRNDIESDVERASTLDPRSRHVSTYSEYRKSVEESKRAQTPQSPGLLPVMDVGGAIKQELPDAFLNTDSLANQMSELQEKEDILKEIQTIRRSIDVLRTDANRLSLSTDIQTVPRTRRTRSGDSELSRLAGDEGQNRTSQLDPDRLSPLAANPRPKSVPLGEISRDWESYVQDRKLFSPPIGAAKVEDRISPSPAVREAIAQRKRHESQGSSGMTIVPERHVRADSAGERRHTRSIDATQRVSPVIASPQPVRPAERRSQSATLEEMQTRHRELMRTMQAPLTQATEEQANIDKAKARWERARELEKREVTRRQSEQNAALAKGEEERRRSGDADIAFPARPNRYSRHSSRRMSSMKVEDWQNFQEETSKASTSKVSDRRK